MRFAASLIVGLAVFGSAPALRADDVVFRYDGDVLPYEESGGFASFNACEPPCEESVIDGAFRLSWAEPGDQVNYHTALVSGLETLWVEWRFLSTRPIGQFFAHCDGEIKIRYGSMSEILRMYGDSVFDRAGTAGFFDLPVAAYRTYRLESVDGVRYRVSVDGWVLLDAVDDGATSTESVAIRGLGGCTTKTATETINEWDYVWYGTLSSGERVVAADPPAGFLDPRFENSFDRFAVTFDAANFAHIDDISVDSIGGDTPEVIATRRRDGDGPETFEVVLDRSVSTLGQTRFIFDDGTTRNIVDYSFIRGDSSGDGAIDLRDFRDLQRCIGQTAVDHCTAFDFDGDGAIDTQDAASFLAALTPPRE